VGADRCGVGGNRGLLLGLARRGTPDRLRASMIAAGPLQREVDTQNKRYALRFIAVLALAAACCAGLVGSIIWIVIDL
jgi:hypothetical protein